MWRSRNVREDSEVNSSAEASSQGKCPEDSSYLGLYCLQLDSAVGLKPTRTIGEDEAIHLRLEAVNDHAFQILQAR